MIAFAGLGNPGTIYKLNRHNVGFMVIDYAKEYLKIEKTDVINKAMIMKALVNDKYIYLVKPLSYINNSGQALFNLSSLYTIKPNDIIIIHDDIYLPLGKIKIKLKGGDGGHKGVESIIRSFGTNEIPRIKIGIKGEENIQSSNYAEYVLSNFSNDELGILEEVIDRAYKAMISIINEGINNSINKFNRRKQ